MEKIIEIDPTIAIEKKKMAISRLITLTNN
jgi:hypothetical protein